MKMSLPSLWLDFRVFEVSLDIIIKVKRGVYRAGKRYEHL